MKLSACISAKAVVSDNWVDRTWRTTDVSNMGDYLCFGVKVDLAAMTSDRGLVRTL